MQDVALTETPVLGNEENPIAPPGELSANAVRCSQCGYRNNPAWKTCYACGVALEAKQVSAAGPRVKPIATFENGNPFSGGEVVASHASEGRKALRVDKGYASMEQAQDWLGYDFLKADLFTGRSQAAEPLRRDPRHGDRRLLDPGQLLDGRAAGEEHLDHPGQAALRRRESSAGADADLERDHEAGLRHRRQAARAAVHRQPPPGARRLA